MSLNREGPGPLTQAQINTRLNIINDSDVTCACGADPRAEGLDAARDPGWQFEIIPDNVVGGGEDAYTAEAVCPTCYFRR